MQVLVTGANGFIGRELCLRLRQDGHSVAAVMCSTAAAAAASATGANAHADADTQTEQPAHAGAGSVLRIDALTDRNAWAMAMRGKQAVVHLAARAHRGEATDAATRADFQRINVDFTQLLLDCAIEAGIEHMVFMSSSKVFGERSEAYAHNQWQRFAAHSAAAPHGPYGASKLAAERLLQDGCARHAMQLTILRPPLVYGPGVGGNLRALQRIVARGIPLPLASINNRRSLVHRSSLNDAIARALLNTRPSQQRIYTMADMEVSTPALITLIAAGLMRPARLLPFPVGVLRLLGRISGRSAAVERLSESFVVDASAIAAELQWRPRTDAQADWREIGQAFLRDNAG